MQRMILRSALSSFMAREMVSAPAAISPASRELGASFVAVGTDVTILARGAVALAHIFFPASEQPFAGSGGIY